MRSPIRSARSRRPDEISLYTRLVVRALRVDPGCAAAGQAIGQVEARHEGPSIERVPPGAQALDRRLDLIVQEGDIVGVSAQRAAVPTLQAVFGKYVLKLHPMILLVALAGAQTEAASMNTILEGSQSQTPVLGFTVCYAVSNVLLAIWGPIIVALA